MFSKQSSSYLTANTALSILNIAGLCGNYHTSKTTGSRNWPLRKPSRAAEIIKHWSKVSQHLSNRSGLLFLDLISYGSSALPCLVWIQKVVLLDTSHNPGVNILFLPLCLVKTQLQTYPVQWRGIWTLGTDLSLFENFPGNKLAVFESCFNIVNSP